MGDCLNWDNQIHVCLSHTDMEGCTRFIRDVDHSNYELKAGTPILCVGVHIPSDAHPHRKIVIVIDGEEKESGRVDDRNTVFWWGYNWSTLNHEHKIRFELRNSRTDQLIMQRSTWINATEDIPNDYDEEGEGVDYHQIKRDTREIVEDSTDKVVQKIDGLEGLIGTVKDKVNNLKDQISNQSSSFKEITETALNNSFVYLFDHLEYVIKPLDLGLTGISNRIEELEFPTINSIKEAFLDVCEDLAESLWDKILDKIEERYK